MLDLLWLELEVMQTSGCLKARGTERGVEVKSAGFVPSPVHQCLPVYAIGACQLTFRLSLGGSAIEAMTGYMRRPAQRSTWLELLGITSTTTTREERPST